MAFSFAKEFNATANRAYMSAKTLLEYNGGYNDTDEEGNPITEPVLVKSISIGSSSVTLSGQQGIVELDLPYDGSLGNKYDTENYKLSEHEGDNIWLNMPGHMTDTCIKISSNAAALKAISQGKVGIRLTSYGNKFGEQVGVEWVDL